VRPLSDVGYVGFDGDNTETDRGFAGTHNQSQIAESVASDVFPASRSLFSINSGSRI